MPRVDIGIIIIIRTLRFQVAEYMKLVDRELNSLEVFWSYFSSVSYESSRFILIAAAVNS